MSKQRVSTTVSCTDHLLLWLWLLLLLLLILNLLLALLQLLQDLLRGARRSRWPRRSLRHHLHGRTAVVDDRRLDRLLVLVGLIGNVLFRLLFLLGLAIHLLRTVPRPARAQHDLARRSRSLVADH